MVRGPARGQKGAPGPGPGEHEGQPSSQRGEGQGRGRTEQTLRGGLLTAQAALHPPPVSIKPLISILTTQLIRLQCLIMTEWACGGGAALSAPPRSPQELRFIDQKRHTRRPWPRQQGGVQREQRGGEAGGSPSALCRGLGEANSHTVGVPPGALQVSPPPLRTSGLLVSTCTHPPADFGYPKLSQAGRRMAWTLQTRGHTSAHPSSLGAWSRCVGVNCSLKPLSGANRDTWGALPHAPDLSGHAVRFIQCSP